MRIYSAMFAATTAPPSRPSVTAGRAGRFVEFGVGALALALFALPAPARAAETVTISSVKASPASVQPGQAVTFTATMTSSQSESNYPVEFSLVAPGGTNAIQGLDTATFTAGASLTETYGGTLPASAKAGTYTLYVDVYNPTYSVKYAQTTTTLTVAAASAAAPTDMSPPVVSGTAQVGDALASTTGTWTGASSYAYQWAGNGTKIAGATAATYTPVSSDAGHTLTSTVTATGSSGTAASATSAPTVAIVAASSPSASNTGSNGVAFTALHTYFMSPTGSDSNNGLTAATAWATPNHAVNCGDVIIAAAGSYGPFQGDLGKGQQLPVQFWRSERVAGRRLLRHAALRRFQRRRVRYHDKGPHERQHGDVSGYEQQLGGRGLVCKYRCSWTGV